MLNETKERISHLNFSNIWKVRLFQTFLFFFPIIRRWSLCPMVKKFRRTKLHHRRPMSDDRRLFEGLNFNTEQDFWDYFDVEFWQCYVNNLVGPQNVDQLNLVNCRAIVTWIVAYAGKVAYAGFSLKVLFHYSAVKVYHVYDISNLIFLHSNCIDSIYRNPGGLVVWYLKRWPGFDSQPVSMLSTVASF